MTYAYIRVSSIDQNLDRQKTALREYRPGLTEDYIFSDKQSGKNTNRKRYQALKSVLREGDEVVIKELDRLGRNKDEVKDELKWFRERKIIVRILNVPTTLVDFQGQEWIFDMINNILVEVLAAIAEEERLTTKRRQREGIDCMPIVNGKRISAKTGRGFGREKRDVIDFQKTAQKQKGGLITVSDACRELGIGRTKYYELMRGVSL